MSNRASITMLGTLLDDKIRTALLIARIALRGPMPGIAPLLAAGLSDDSSVSSSMHRAGIAVGALAAAESMLTGDHQFHWHRKDFGDSFLARNAPHKLKQVNAKKKGDVAKKKESKKTKKSKGKEPATEEFNLDDLPSDVKDAEAVLDLGDKNISDAINKSAAILAEMGRLATSAVSYWHVVAGHGAVPAASSAALMGSSLGLGLVVTYVLYKQVSDTNAARHLRNVTQRNVTASANYNAASKKVSEAADQTKYILAYALTGSLGVVGVMTGLLSAAKTIDNPAWQQANFYPMLWAAYSLMKAQVDIMRSLKSAPAPFVLVRADTARDRHFAHIRGDEDEDEV